MIIYIDENLPPDIANGLNLLQQTLNKKLGVQIEVRSIREVFGSGAKDEEWIPHAGNQGACVITQDAKIQRIKHQAELCKKFRIGLFFMNQTSGRGLSYWQIVQLCINSWEEIITIALREDKPFCYKQTKKGFAKLAL
jgi:predicted nuclease of predicted toxin-antitoxin system